jgi:hypothetical protein
MYENIYIIDGIIFYFTTDPSIVQTLPYVKKWTSEYDWRPIIRIISSADEIRTIIAQRTRTETIELAAYGDIIWAHNIGHALFDGLYPLYTALVKFGYKDSPFTVFTNITVEERTKDIVNNFSGNPVYNYNNVDKTRVYHIKKLISGTGETGNRVITQQYTLYGEKEYNALTYFKERMYKTYNLTVDKPLGKPLKAIIVDNKRYSPKEKNAMKELIEKHTDTEVDIKYIFWQSYKTFAEQLKEIGDTDIHITGPGTGMMYMPFLKKGAVNINLGYIERTETNYDRPNLRIAGTKTDYILPAYLEQSVCAGANYVRTIYYDRYNVNDIETHQLTLLIHTAKTIVGTCVENNLNTDALIFKEYCKRSKNAIETCRYLTGIAYMIELFIHEHPEAVKPSFVDIELLRQIKREFNYGTKYDILPKL